MPVRKNQHYVPKLLLRHFSNDLNKKLINIFNPNTLFYRTNCPLDSQCQKDYFYGKDGILEEYFSKLEGKVAPIIANIIKTKSLSEIKQPYYDLLFEFCILLSFRTQNDAEQINEMINKTLQEFIKYDKRFPVKDKELIFKLNNAPARLILMLLSRLNEANDLGLALIINNSKNKFFTSDNPAIRYNQYLEHREQVGGNTGLFTKGLQIFFPISPDCMLLYYDQWAYKIGSRKNQIVKVDSDFDVDQINFIQILNCHSLTFSNKETSYLKLKELSKKGEKIRNQELTLFRENHQYTDDVGNIHKIYQSHSIERNSNLKLSFIKQTKMAKKHILSDYIAQLRNEKLRWDNQNPAVNYKK